jgi:AraC-like DNA-binding protein
MRSQTIAAPVTERVIEFAGARVLAKRYDARLRLPLHAHEHAALVLVLDGMFEETCQAGNELRLPGTLRVLPAGEPHANEYGDGGARSFLVELPPHIESAWVGGRASLLRVAHLSAGTRAATIVGDMYREYCAHDDMAPVALHGLGLELLAELARSSTSKHHAPRWLERARARFDGEFRQAIDIAEIARDAGVHASHFNRTFRHFYACSPFEYVARLRIAWAKRELALSERSIATIAVAAGYSDQANFTRRFRQLTGETPGAYRAAHARYAGKKVG